MYYLQKKNFPTWHSQYAANDTTEVNVVTYLATTPSTNTNKSSNYLYENNEPSFLKYPGSSYSYMKTVPQYTDGDTPLVWKGTGSYAETTFSQSKTYSYGYGFSQTEGWFSDIMDQGYLDIRIIHNGTKIYAKAVFSSGYEEEEDIITSNPPKCLFFELTGGGGGSAGCVSTTKESTCYRGGGGGGGAGIYGILDFTQTDTFYFRLGNGGAGGSSGTWGNTSGSSGQSGSASWLDTGDAQLKVGGGGGGTVSAGGAGGNSYSTYNGSGDKLFNTIPTGYNGYAFIIGRKDGAAGGAGGQGQYYKSGGNINSFSISFGSHRTYSHPTMFGGGTTGYYEEGNGGGASLTGNGTNGGLLMGYSLPWGECGSGGGGGKAATGLFPQEGARGGVGALILRW